MLNITANKSALDNTSDPAQVNHYLGNIQALNAQYLPVIVLNYPDNLVRLQHPALDRLAFAVLLRGKLVE